MMNSGEPTLVVQVTSNYNSGSQWNDSGSGADLDVAIWRPVPDDSTFYIVGDYAQPDYSNPIGSSIIVKVLNDDPKSPMLKLPEKYNWVWDSKNTGSDAYCQIWLPQAPDGYVSLGFICQPNDDAPSISNYMCIRQDLVTKSTAGNVLWDTSGDFGGTDLTIWAGATQATFVAEQGIKTAYNGVAYLLQTSN